MFKHLFKMIWNKKKQNSLLIVEILLSFLVIFAVFTFGLNSYNNYAKPMGIDYQNVWAISYNNTLKTNNGDSLKLFYDNMVDNIKAMPKVIDAAHTSANIPFSTSHMSTGLTHNGDHIQDVNSFMVDENYPKTLNVKLLDGRWYNKTDVGSKQKVIVINNKLKERMFGKASAIGKLYNDDDGKKGVKIIGVLDDIKFNGDYQSLEYAIYNRIDTSSYRWLGKILVKVSPDANAAFESQLYKFMANNLKDSNIEIEHLTNKLTAYNKFTLVPLIILSIVAAFLIINVALGIFGVLWYNINKRRGEIGLRRAVGAPGSSVSAQLVSEAMILATLSLIVGAFFAVQFPLLNVFDLPASVYLLAMLLAVIFIYLLVLVCSLYPGKQASAILPAVALHEE
ncbi:FtsX-like permease family protein [Mucilaginibacter terrigena]|uniref:FtsX-like permease family protein n=1 Tax=Mucilaginibacter terrigena TaxID=2492395 RepID=A0A4Q5LRW3_9SPHI|nr:ABC transporter permease [Mucilaginibacter terrigena]RYU92271.1 FtsX-like permease family protein [Mucilaginibacter terrigena]